VLHDRSELEREFADPLEEGSLTVSPRPPAYWSPTLDLRYT